MPRRRASHDNTTRRDAPPSFTTRLLRSLFQDININIIHHHVSTEPLPLLCRDAMLGVRDIIVIMPRQPIIRHVAEPLRYMRRADEICRRKDSAADMPRKQRCVRQYCNMR